MRNYKRGSIGLLLTMLTGVAACGGDDGAAEEGQVGVVQQAFDSTPDLATPIGQKWVKLGGEPVVGAVTSAVQNLPGNQGQYQRFEEGVIAYTNTFGAVYLPEVIFSRWELDAVLRLRLGLPMEDVIHAGAHDRAAFERGLIVRNDGSSTTYVVSGEIAREYLRLEALLGEPTAEEGPFMTFRVQKFSDGSIFSDGSSAVALWGEILTKYLAVASDLGKPVTSPVEIQKDNQTIGEQAHFQTGAIFQSAAAGGKAHKVTGDILTDYEQRYGGPAGWLEFPIGDTGTTGSGDEFNDFQQGVLVNHRANDTHKGVNAFGSLVFKLAKAAAWPVDGQGTVETYVKYRLSLDGTQFIDAQYPEDKTLAYPPDIEPNLANDLGVASSAARFSAVVEVWDWDEYFTYDDERVATWSEDYSIDNLWGARNFPHSSSNASADFAVQSTYPYDRSDFRGNMWWPFSNFTTDDLSYSQFAQAFEDVNTGDSTGWHPFNAFWYEAAGRNIAEGGNCFGMSLESIYAERNQSLFAEPIIRHFDNTQSGEDLDLVMGDAEHTALISELNIKQSYQIGSDVINYFISNLAKGNLHDPRLVFEHVDYALSVGEPMIISISSFFFEHSHAVRPYKTERDMDCTQGGTSPCDRIYIADPNFPNGLPALMDPVTKLPRVDPTYIEIDVDDDYYYTQCDPNSSGCYNYSGGVMTGDRMFEIPYTGMLDHQATTPFGLTEFLELVHVFIMGDSGSVGQITDAAGGTVFKPGLSAPASTWDDLNQGPSRIPDLTPIPVSGGSGPAPQIFASKGKGVSYTYDLMPAPGKPAGTPYEAAFSSAYMSARVLIPGAPSKPERLTVHDVNTPNKAVSLAVPANGVAKKVVLTVGSPQKYRWAELSKMELAPGQTIKVRLDNGGYEIVIENSGPATSAELTVNAGRGATPVFVGNIEIPGGISAVEYQLPRTALTLSGQVPGNDGWLLAPVTIKLSAKDFSSKGINLIEYSRNRSTWETYGGPFVYPDEGDTTLFYRAMDQERNLEIAKSEELKIDTRKPEVTVSTDKACYTRVDLFVAHFGASDPVPGSGIESVAGSFDGNPVSNGQTVDLLWLALGAHTVSALAEDVAGWTTQREAPFELIATRDSIKALIKELRARGGIDSDGIENSLLQEADHNLRVVLKHVQSQAGKHISYAAAALLAGDIQYVMDHP